MLLICAKRDVYLCSFLHGCGEKKAACFSESGQKVLSTAKDAGNVNVTGSRAIAPLAGAQKTDAFGTDHLSGGMMLYR